LATPHILFIFVHFVDFNTNSIGLLQQSCSSILLTQSSAGAGVPQVSGQGRIC